MAALDRRASGQVAGNWLGFLPAWASVGRERPDVRARVLAPAGPRPPRISTHDGFELDEVMYERGTAISCLTNFAGHASEVVPVLAEALGSTPS